MEGTRTSLSARSPRDRHGNSRTSVSALLSRGSRNDLWFQALFYFPSSISHLLPSILHLPSPVNPKPVGGVATDSFLEGAVDVEHDGFAGTRLAVVARGDFLAGFD